MSLRNSIPFLRVTCWCPCLLILIMASSFQSEKYMFPVGRKIAKFILCLLIYFLFFLKSKNKNQSFIKHIPWYATIPKGWAMDTPEIVFTSSPSKLECCILVNTEKNFISYDDILGAVQVQYVCLEFAKKWKHYRKSLPVKVCIHPEEPVSVEVDAETVWPAQFIFPDFCHIGAVTKCPSNVRTLHGVFHPVREK